MRTLATAIAREPDGESRIPRETFAQVFDRMEREQDGAREISWATIVEYFTKRGKPLSKEEIYQLQHQDQVEQEREELKKKTEDDQQKRKMARMLDEKNENENFEEYELRQQLE